jgi:hypothetical protein
MASGSSKAHSNQRRPGKSNSVTAAAVAEPSSSTPSATPTDSSADCSA